MTLLGVISDTHGLLRPEALEALRGSELIIHAGDVGEPVVLERLGEIAPVLAVRGNVDTAPWARELPETNLVESADTASTSCTTGLSSLSIPCKQGSRLWCSATRISVLPRHAMVSCSSIRAAPARAVSGCPSRLLACGYRTPVCSPISSSYPSHKGAGTCV
jgi:hypothetical protein